jgi:pseudouridine-5'-phosphate glycosidase
VPLIQFAPEVGDALAAGRPVVALESTIITFGLPRPDNVRIAREIEQAVRDGGAVPATIALLDGRAHIGLDDAALRRVACEPETAKVSVRDLPFVAARGGVGATTVAATAHLASLAGIAVFATGGLGGVHREAAQTWDESADLATLARTPSLVVCAGVKSILDVSATLERLETLSVGVAGYRTHRFPGFYLRDSGFPVDWRVESAAEAAAVLRARDAAETGSAIVLANPVDEAHELDPALHDRLLESGLQAAAAAEVRGKAVTPFLLDWFHRESSGASLRTNVALVLANARLAAEIAAAYAAPAA